MFRYFINYILVFLLIISIHEVRGQEKIEAGKEENTIKKDTVIYKTGYGIRLGVDLSKPSLSFVDKSYSGLELVGDYRISKNWYIASEVGYEKETTFESFSTSTAKGSYIRIGANYNAYENWLDMNNEIFIGGRYGFALLEQTLDSYTPNVTVGANSLPGTSGQTTNTPYFPGETIDTPITESGLTAHWAEIQLGLKVETFKNLFIGAGFSYKILISIDDQTNFKTLFSPGFNRVFESNTGFGFFYTLSYMIPFVNK